MSTYYSLTCAKCKEEVSFVRDGVTLSWMAGAPEDVFAFMRKHLDLGCVSHLSVMSEHNEAYGTYAEFDPAKPPVSADSHAEVGQGLRPDRS